MPSYCLTIAYEGTNFHGWQTQLCPRKTAIPSQIVSEITSREGYVELRTAQWAIKQAVSKVFREKVHVQGASRTDSGVHALSQTASFTVSGKIGPPEDRIARALNSRLPNDILVTECRPVPDEFRPIRDCEAKGYRYTICTGPTRPLWDRRTSHYIYESLDLDRMNESAALITGEHDFTGFAQASHGRQSPVRTVHECAVSILPTGAMVIDVSGNGFLYNMVRIIAGTLVDVGRRRIDLHAASARAHRWNVGWRRRVSHCARSRGSLRVPLG